MGRHIRTQLMKIHIHIDIFIFLILFCMVSWSLHPRRRVLAYSTSIPRCKSDISLLTVSSSPWIFDQIVLLIDIPHKSHIVVDFFIAVVKNTRFVYTPLSRIHSHTNHSLLDSCDYIITPIDCDNFAYLEISTINLAFLVLAFVWIWFSLDDSVIFYVGEASPMLSALAAFVTVLTWTVY